MKFKNLTLNSAEDSYLTIVDEDGNEELCQIIFTLDSEELGKKYVIFARVSEIEKYYADDESDDEQIEVGAACYVEAEDGNGELKEIETDEEWALIEEALGEYDETLEERQHECHCHHGSYCEGDECECGCNCDDECECDCDCEGEHKHEEHKCCCKEHK